jgi:hypothetical protein
MQRREALESETKERNIKTCLEICLTKNKFVSKEAKERTNFHVNVVFVLKKEKRNIFFVSLVTKKS